MATRGLAVALGAPAAGTVLAPGAAFSISGNVTASFTVDPPLLSVAVAVDGAVVPATTQFLSTGTKGSLLLAFHATGHAPASGAVQVTVSAGDDEGHTAHATRTLVVRGQVPLSVPRPAVYVDVVSNAPFRRNAFSTDAELLAAVDSLRANPLLVWLADTLAKTGTVLAGPAVLTEPPPGAHFPEGIDLTRLGLWTVNRAFPVVPGNGGQLPTLTPEQATAGFSSIALPTTENRTMPVDFTIAVDAAFLYTVLGAVRPGLEAYVRQQMPVELTSVTFTLTPAGNDTALTLSLAASAIGWSDVDASATVTLTFGRAPVILVAPSCGAPSTPVRLVTVPVLKGLGHSLQVNVVGLPAAWLLNGPFAGLVDQLADLVVSALGNIPRVIPYRSGSALCPFPGLLLDWTGLAGTSSGIRASGGVDAVTQVNRGPELLSMTLSGPGTILGQPAELSGGTIGIFTVTLSGPITPDQHGTVWTVKRSAQGQALASGTLDFGTYGGTASFTAFFPLPKKVKAGGHRFRVEVTATETSVSAPGKTLTVTAAQAVTVVAIDRPSPDR